MTIDPRILTEFNKRAGFKLEDTLIVLTNVGSHSHGTYVAPTEPDAIDDVDYMGVVIPPAHRVIGLQPWEHCQFQHEELDVVIYSLQKFVRLLLKSNPNVLGLLWMQSEHYIYRNALALELIHQREIFSSLRAYNAFIGYAHGQLERMTHYNQGVAAEYSVLTDVLLDAQLDIHTVLDADQNKLNHLGGGHGTDLHRVLVDFRHLHKQHFSGYMGAKRKALVTRFGYDCKNAAHLIRLMRMCIEFLETGVLNVYRTHDAEELRAIKSGAWPLDVVKEEAERLFILARAACDISTLPAEPNELAADILLTNMQLDTWRL